MPKTSVSPASPNFAMLKAALLLEEDRNLKNTLNFIMASLGACENDSIEIAFSETNFPNIRASLRLKAQKHWPKKSTLRGHLSRITKISHVALSLLEQGVTSADGSDWEYLSALKELRAAIANKNFSSLSSLEKEVHGRKSSYLFNLFKKNRKYSANKSREIHSRLKELCEFLELEWAEMRPKLIELPRDKTVSSKLKPSSFAYFLKSKSWPPELLCAIAEIEQFHMSMSPGRLQDGTSKLRTDKSHWKIRGSDERCASKENLHILLGSFYGYCTLPSDNKEAERLARKRLEITATNWQEADVKEYTSWMLGEGMKPSDLSISMLFNLALIERWLHWTAKRNGGISKTQPTYCLTLCGLTNPKTGAIAQSYEIARQVLGFPDLPKRMLIETERTDFQANMKSWREYCDSNSTQFRMFQKSFSSSKVKKKRKVSLRHEKLLALTDPLIPIQELMNRLHQSEPRHLDSKSQSWLVWARNMTMLELMVSNPIRAENFCSLNYRDDGKGKLRRKDGQFKIVLQKHDVKNPHREKELGYFGDVSPSAGSWLGYYIEEVRPNWPATVPAGKFLFLTDSGRAISVVELRTIFIRLSQIYLPEYDPVNPHAFRHIVATSWLKNHPDDFITVALILGDRIETVMRDYAHLASSDGFLRYHQALADYNNRKPPANGGR